MNKEKPIKSLSKEERMRIKGLNNFINNADEESRKDFRRVCLAMNIPAHKWAEDIYAAGFMSCLNKVTIQIAESIKEGES